MIAGPLLALAGALSVYKLYLLYAGRSTRGKHTNYCTETSVKALKKTVAKSRTRPVSRPASLERTAILAPVVNDADAPAETAPVSPPVRRAPVEPAFLVADMASGFEPANRLEDTGSTFTLADLLLHEQNCEQGRFSGHIPMQTRSYGKQSEILTAHEGWCSAGAAGR